MSSSPPSSQAASGESAASESAASESTETTGSMVSREDLMTLTKARLSTLVAVTTVCGYFAALRGGGGGGGGAQDTGFSFWTLGHTLFGTLLAAFGAAVFNQVMEIDVDARMRRTENRPLPGRRISTGMAFGLGWIMSAMGIVHLGMKVNVAAAGWAAATLLTYLFIYTPLKRRSTLNTVVGAVAGAFPPLIGWSAGGGDPLAAGAWFLFSLLFWWQLPHFAAINWMYRDEYQRGGFVMWSNDDDDGARTSRLALWFSVAVTLLPVQAVVFGVTHWWFLVPGVLLGALMLRLAMKFRRSREPADARKLFFYTLLYLPLILIAALLAWTRI